MCECDSVGEFLQLIFYRVCVLSYFSRVQLFTAPWTIYSPPGSSVHGILQARILEWVAITNSRGSSKLRDWTWVSCIAGGFITNWATREGFVSQVNNICNSRLLRTYWYNFDEFEIVNLGFVARIYSPISILELNKIIRLKYQPFSLNNMVLRLFLNSYDSVP